MSGGLSPMLTSSTYHPFSPSDLMSPCRNTLLFLTPNFQVMRGCNHPNTLGIGHVTRASPKWLREQEQRPSQDKQKPSWVWEEGWWPLALCCQSPVKGRHRMPHVPWRCARTEKSKTSTPWASYENEEAWEPGACSLGPVSRSELQAADVLRMYVRVRATFPLTHGCVVNAVVF